MDISIKINSTRLNVRVAILLEHAGKLVFERDKNGFYFPVGGRIKIGEKSRDAAIREISEELGINVFQLDLVAIVENYFDYDSEPFHEICFVYSSFLDNNLELPINFVHMTLDEITTSDVRPSVIKKIVKEKLSTIKHYIVDDRIAQQLNPPAKQN